MKTKMGNGADDFGHFSAGIPATMSKERDAAECAKLLQALRSGIVAEKIFENGEDVLAVFNHAFQN